MMIVLGAYVGMNDMVYVGCTEWEISQKSWQAQMH